MSDNLALWHLVEKTSPEHVKPITGKSYSGNSPKPHYLVMRATETFGPCGIGWGFNILSQNFVPGADGDVHHFAHVKVWYTLTEKAGDGGITSRRGEVEHVGGTPYCGKRKNGAFFTDEDAPKKSVTDALVKALSMIGFAGDIFMGRYDDSKYVSELRDEEREAKRTDAAPKLVEVSSGPAKPKEAAISSAAIGFAREMKSCLTLQDLDAFKRTPEFKAAWGAMNEVDRKHIVATGEQLRAKLTVSDILMAGE